MSEDRHDIVLWTPTREVIARSQIMRFARMAGLADFDAMLRLSLADPAQYWALMLEFLDWRWQEPYDAYVDTKRGYAFANWFVGGKLNLTDTVLAPDADAAGRNALICVHENGDEDLLSHDALRRQVHRFARVLIGRGISPGDRIAMLLPSGAEAAIALLAAAHIGAIAVPLFSGFGEDAVIARLESCQARCLVATNGFRRRGRWVDLLGIVRHARSRLPLLDHVILKRREGEITEHPDWDNLMREASDQPLPARGMAPNDPFMIIFTSGTTGAPKGVVHTHGGFPLKAAHDAAIHFDIGRDDCWFWPADMGWVVGPITVIGGLARGATLVLYDGAPDFPDSSRIAQIISRHQVSHFGTSPTLIRNLAALPLEEVLPPDLDTTRLRILISSGEVMDHQHMAWFSRHLGGDRCPVINYTGGTEVSGALLSNVVVRSIRSTDFNASSPGIAVDILDETGSPAGDQPGQLVVRAPFVGMTCSFWQDDARYLETYWSHYPNIWVHGDLAARRTGADGNIGSFALLGRSDDTLKIAGKRVGPSEIEDVVRQLPDVKEATAIGVDDDRKGQSLVLFAVVHETADLAVLREAIHQEVGRRLGKPFRPQVIHFVPDLPKTKSGKIMRRIVKRAYLGLPLGDFSSIENSAAVLSLPKPKP